MAHNLKKRKGSLRRRKSSAALAFFKNVRPVVVLLLFALFPLQEKLVNRGRGKPHETPGNKGFHVETGCHTGETEKKGTPCTATNPTKSNIR